MTPKKPNAMTVYVLVKVKKGLPRYESEKHL